MGKTRLTKALLLILALLPLLQFAYMGQFSRLLYDDYVFMAVGRDLGPWEGMVYMRGTWNGAYTEPIVHGIFARFGSHAPRMMPVILVILWLLTLAQLIKLLLGWFNVNAHRNAIALAAAALTIAAMINADHSLQAFYFFSAAVNYGLPLAAFMLFLAILCNSDRMSARGPRLWAAAVAASLFCFVAAGLSAMYMVFQAMALGILSVPIALYAKRTGRKARLVLIAAGLVGTAVSFLVQITAPGVANRVAGLSPVESVSKRALPDLAKALAEALFWFAGQEKTFAGFIMLFGIALFVALLLPRSPRAVALRRPAQLARAPLILGLIVQLAFIPILWAHTSDIPSVLGQFSFAYSSVIVLNLGSTLLLLLLLWRRQNLGARLLENRNGILIISGGVLLAVLVLFAATHTRSVHHRASRYLFATALQLIGMLCWQLAQMLEDEKAKRYGQAAIVMTLLTAASYIVLLGVPLYTLGKTNARITTPTVLLHVSLGLVWGAYAGYLIRASCHTAPTQQTWLRRIGLLGLAVAFVIGAGIMLGQARAIPNLQTFAREWDERERLIISQRDSGQLNVVVAPLSYDLSWHLLYQRMSKPGESNAAVTYYGLESISVEVDQP